MGVISRIEQGRAIRRTRICAASLDGENSRYNGTNKKGPPEGDPNCFSQAVWLSVIGPKGGHSPVACRSKSLQDL